jgi:hypothetical protein
MTPSPRRTTPALRASGMRWQRRRCGSLRCAPWWPGRAWRRRPLTLAHRHVRCRSTDAQHVDPPPRSRALRGTTPVDALSVTTKPVQALWRAGRCACHRRRDNLNALTLPPLHWWHLPVLRLQVHLLVLVDC